MFHSPEGNKKQSGSPEYEEELESSDIMKMASVQSDFSRWWKGGKKNWSFLLFGPEGCDVQENQTYFEKAKWYAATEFSLP